MRTDDTYCIFCIPGKLPKKSEQHVLQLGGRTKNQKKSQFKAVGAMWNVTRVILDNFYRPFNEEIAQLLDDDRFLWK